MIRALALIIAAAAPAAAQDRQLIDQSEDWSSTIARGTDGVYFCEAATFTRSATMRVTVDSSGWYAMDVWFENAVSSHPVWDLVVQVGAVRWTLTDARAYNDHTRNATTVSFNFGRDPGQVDFMRDLARARDIEFFDVDAKTFETFSGRGSAAALASMESCRCIIMGEC